MYSVAELTCCFTLFSVMLTVSFFILPKPLFVKLVRYKKGCFGEDFFFCSFVFLFFGVFFSLCWYKFTSTVYLAGKVISKVWNTWLLFQMNSVYFNVLYQKFSYIFPKVLNLLIKLCTTQPSYFSVCNSCLYPALSLPEIPIFGHERTGYGF